MMSENHCTHKIETCCLMYAYLGFVCVCVLAKIFSKSTGVITDVCRLNGGGVVMMMVVT